MRNLIGISGKMGSGKDTVAEIIQSNSKYDFETKKFAGKLKDITCLILGCTREDLENQEFKSAPLPKDWDDSHGINTPRELLQVLGTDCGRDMIHTKIWQNALFVDYRCTNHTNRASMGNVIDYSDCDFPNWLITDPRFINEADAIKERSGIMIRVNRPRVAVVELSNGTKRLAKPNEVKEHASETGLDDYKDFDYVIENVGTLEELDEKVIEILKKEKLY